MAVDALKMIDELTFETLDLGEIPPDPMLVEAMTPPAGDIVQELRTSHHLLAKVLASGVDVVAASARCGMTVGRVKKLQNDPTFNELLEYYKAQNAELFEHVKDRLAALGMTFVDVLQQRVMDTPEKFTNRELKDFAAEFLERTIAPTKASAPGGGTAPVNIAINFVKPKEENAKELELRALPVDPLKELK